MHATASHHEFEIIQDEPQPMIASAEPMTRAFGATNPETGSEQGSLCDIPAEEQILEIVLPPPQEPEEDPITDDWAASELYSYVYQIHYDHMKKKKLITDYVACPRPETPSNQKGMSQQ